MSNARDKANIPALNFSSTGIDDNATSTAITIDSSEKVGIGTSTPESPLHVTGTNALLPPLRVQTASSTGAGAFSIRQDATQDRLTLGVAYSSASAVIGHRVKPSNTSESDATGFLSSSASNVARTAMRFGTDGAIRFYGANQQATAVNSVVAMTERFTIDSSGYVGIGTASPSAVLHLDATGGAFMKIERTGQDHLYFSTDGTNGMIRTSSATGALRFQTNGNNERMRINSSGNVGIGTTSPSQKLDVVGSIEVSDGIYIGGTAAANKLDDYEEGTWTPGYEGTTGSAGSLAYNTQAGRYTKIGNTVFVTGEIKLSNKGSFTGVIRISGLPFAPLAGLEINLGSIVLGNVDFATGVVGFNGVLASGSNFYIWKTTDAAIEAVLNTGDATNTSNFYFNFTYTTTA